MVPGERLVDHDAKREDVRAVVEDHTAGLLGGHVGRGTHHGTGRGEVGRQ